MFKSRAESIAFYCSHRTGKVSHCLGVDVYVYDAPMNQWLITDIELVSRMLYVEVFSKENEFLSDSTKLVNVQYPDISRIFDGGVAATTARQTYVAN